MLRLADLILESERDLAYLEAISMGRPVSGYWDAKAAVKKLQYFATSGWDNQGQTSLNTPGFVNMTFRQPFGVVAAIIPWNVPVYFFINKVAPAIAAGNTVVIKSSEKAPLTVRPCFISFADLVIVIRSHSRQNLRGSSRVLAFLRGSSISSPAMGTSQARRLRITWISA